MRYQYLADFLTVFRYFLLTVLRYWVHPKVPPLIGALSRAFRARRHLIACRLYPSHGLLRFITSRSLASTLREARRLRRRLCLDSYSLIYCIIFNSLLFVFKIYSVCRLSLCLFQCHLWPIYFLLILTHSKKCNVWTILNLNS